MTKERPSLSPCFQQKMPGHDCSCSYPYIISHFLYRFFSNVHFSELSDPYFIRAVDAACGRGRVRMPSAFSLGIGKRQGLKALGSLPSFDKNTPNSCCIMINYTTSGSPHHPYPRVDELLLGTTDRHVIVGGPQKGPMFSVMPKSFTQKADVGWWL